jgi:hypothetical protein
MQTMTDVAKEKILVCRKIKGEIKRERDKGRQNLIYNRLRGVTLGGFDVKARNVE